MLVPVRNKLDFLPIEIIQIGGLHVLGATELSLCFPVVKSDH